MYFVCIFIKHGSPFLNGVPILTSFSIKIGKKRSLTRLTRSGFMSLAASDNSFASEITVEVVFVCSQLDRRGRLLINRDWPLCDEPLFVVEEPQRLNLYLLLLLCYEGRLDAVAAFYDASVFFFAASSKRGCRTITRPHTKSSSSISLGLWS